MPSTSRTPQSVSLPGESELWMLGDNTSRCLLRRPLLGWVHFCWDAQAVTHICMDAADDSRAGRGQYCHRRYWASQELKLIVAAACRHLLICYIYCVC